MNRIELNDLHAVLTLSDRETVTVTGGLSLLPWPPRPQPRPKPPVYRCQMYRGRWYCFPVTRPTPRPPSPPMRGPLG